MSKKIYHINGIRKRASELTIDDIKILIKNYINSGGELSSKCFKAINNLPNVNVVREIVKKEGYTLREFLNTFENYKYKCRVFDKEKYNIYVEKYKKLSEDQIIPLQAEHLIKYDLPTADWFIRYCPDPSIKTWTQFTRWCGFIPNCRNKVDIQNKDLVAQKIIEYENKIKRPIRQGDFKVENIGFSHYVVTELWGSIPNCRKELGLKKTIQHPFKQWSYYDEKMKIALKNMYDSIQTTEFTWRDWRKYKKIPLTKENFIAACKRQGIDVNSYLNDLGYKLAIRNGAGCNHVFEDGEICVSNLEYRFSIFLRENQIEYKRNVKYNVFDETLCNKNYNCDYVINNTYWIEICGMTKANENNWKDIKGHNKLERDYYNKTVLKEESLIRHNIPYLFLFRKDFDNNMFKEKTLEFIKSIK